jgi:glutaredoxin
LSIKVRGENRKHKVVLYALSTCPWCNRAKKFLKDNKIEYEYVDVDLSSVEDREQIRKDILSRGGRLGYPAIIVDNRLLINGFQQDKLQEALEI